MFPDLSLLALFYRHPAGPVGPVPPYAIQHLLAAKTGPRRDRRLRVLVADNDPTRAEDAALLLRQGGHDAGAASDGASTLRLAQVGRPDVVLIDLHFAGPTGLDLAQQLVSGAAEGRGLVVAVSGIAHLGPPTRWEGPRPTGNLLAPPDANTAAQLMLVGEWFAGRRR